MEEKIKYALNNVNDWLKFGETKLAGLIIFNGAILIGVMQICSNLSELDFYIRSAICSQFFTNIWSIIFSFWGLLPVGNREGKVRDNLLFWGDIQRYSAHDYYKELQDFYNNNSNFELDIADQIVNNSKIAVRKYKIFKIALLITIIGFLVSIIQIILAGISVA